MAALKTFCLTLTLRAVSCEQLGLGKGTVIWRYSGPSNFERFDVRTT
jgi:hypothetical protein